MTRRQFIATAPLAAAGWSGLATPGEVSMTARSDMKNAGNFDRTEKVKQFINRQYEHFFEVFQYLNRHPEILFDLPLTAARIRAEIAAIDGFEIIDGLAPCSYVAVLHNGPGPVYAYRTDLDALPIEDLTSNNWRSEKSGASHCCGHSTHASIALGVCAAMSALRDEWSGTFWCVFQACEEAGTPELGSGAQCMIRNGLFKKLPLPKAMLAIHVEPNTPAGQVRVRKGFAFAHTSMFELTVRGVAGHGGAPYKGAKDTILLTSRIVDGIQSIVSRELNPLTETAIVSVGSFHAGAAPNAIPAEARLGGTIRCFSPAVYEKITRAIQRIADAQALAAEIEPERFPTLFLPPVYAPQLYNAPEIGDFLLVSYGNILPEDAVHTDEHPVTFGEDFANYGLTEENVPVFLTWMGSVDPAKFAPDGTPRQTLPGLHNGAFSPWWNPLADDTFKTGVLTQTCALMELFGKG